MRDAQASYPEQPIKIIVGFPPGVAPDVTSRLLGDKLTEAWGKPVVVENVTGASGNIAVERVAKAAPDGYTLLMGGNASLVINPNLFAKLPYDPVKDFAYITQIFIVPNILVVRPDVPAKTIAGADRARQGAARLPDRRPRRHRHLAASRRRAVQDHGRASSIQQVPYRGSTAVLPDLLAGRLNIFFGNITNVLPLIREGKLRAFGITSRKRSPQIPELPTMEELGFPGFEATAWFGLMAPAGTPQADHRQAAQGDRAGAGAARRQGQARGARRPARRQHARGVRRDQDRDSAMGQGDQGGRDQGRVTCARCTFRGSGDQAERVGHA